VEAVHVRLSLRRAAPANSVIRFDPLTTYVTPQDRQSSYSSEKDRHLSKAMAQSPLLRIPFKQTDEVDLAAAVGSLISNSYGQDSKDFKDQLSSLNRARQDAVRGAGSDTTARDLLYKWFHMLEMLELRFPELRVPFPW
jgi:hypothetical protein